MRRARVIVSIMVTAGIGALKTWLHTFCDQKLHVAENLYLHVVLGVWWGSYQDLATAHIRLATNQLPRR